MSLAGQYIVLTRSAAGNRSWSAYFKKLGASIYDFSIIETHPADLTLELKQNLRQLNQFDWLVFTSVAGVRYTEVLAAQLGVKLATNQLPTVAVVGAKTAAAARSASMQVTFQPSHSDSATLATELMPVKQRSILLLRAAIASRKLPTILRQRGASVTELAVYNTQLRTDDDPTFSRLIQADEISYLTFASPSAVRGFTQRLTLADLGIAQMLPAIALGQSVATELSTSGFQNIHIASQPTVEAITETILRLSGRTTLI